MIPALSSTTGPGAVSPGAALVAAYLALGPAEGRSSQAAATQLFADSPKALGRRRLSTAVWRLRTEVGPVTGYDLITTSADRLVGGSRRRGDRGARGQGRFAAKRG